MFKVLVGESGMLMSAGKPGASAALIKLGAAATVWARVARRIQTCGNQSLGRMC